MADKLSLLFLPHEKNAVELSICGIFIICFICLLGFLTEIREVIRYKSLGLVGKLLEGKSALRTLSWKVPAATGHGLAVKIPFFLVEAWGSIPP